MSCYEKRLQALRAPRWFSTEKFVRCDRYDLSRIASDKDSYQGTTSVVP